MYFLAHCKKQTHSASSNVEVKEQANVTKDDCFKTSVMSDLNKTSQMRQQASRKRRLSLLYPAKKRSPVNYIKPTPRRGKIINHNLFIKNVKVIKIRKFMFKKYSSYIIWS